MLNNELLMDLADCGSPETLLAAILKHHPNMPRRVPLEEIAASVGIVEIKDRKLEHFEGALVADPTKTTGVIAVKLGTPPRRRRYTIGHELGHFLIPSHGCQIQCTSEDMREHRYDTVLRRQEYEANRFSAGLLMPKPLFVKDMEARGTADLAHVQQLTDLYDVSLEAAANRYAELTSDMCAFIFSKDGKIRYTRSSRTMPRLELSVGDYLSPNSLTARMESIKELSDWEEAATGIWLAKGQGRQPSQVLEQCIVQANGYRVTLIFVEEEQVEERDIDDEIEQSLQFGFGRRK